MAQDWVGSAMLAERNRLAKLLNQRMVRLEKAGINYGAITKYKEFINEYYGESKSGLMRFPEKRTPASAENWNVNISLRRELDLLNYFSSADWQTATVRGARKLEKQRKERFAEFGLHFPSTEVMNEFLKSESWQVLKKIYGSALALRLAGKRNFRKGTEGRASTVQAMDRRLQKFISRMGEGYDLRRMDSDQVQKIFGLSADTIMEAIEESEDLLPL